jgi:prepilin-type N-terminal cleavage/methylation domain-containing protein
MITAIHNRRRGFTLVEIMLVVAIIVLLAAIAIPNWTRGRKRSQATRILNDLRVIDHALDQWAIDNNKSSGQEATLAQLREYFKPTDTPLYDRGVDLFNNPYGPFQADVTPKVNADTFAALEEVAPAEFWSPYIR